MFTPTVPVHTYIGRAAGAIAGVSEPFPYIAAPIAGGFGGQEGASGGKPEERVRTVPVHSGRPAENQKARSERNYAHAYSAG